LPKSASICLPIATDKQVASSTQNIALNALLFLYRQILQMELPYIDNIELAKRSQRIPVVFTRTEVQAILSNLERIHHLMTSLLYGSELRLSECLQLHPHPYAETLPFADFV
jgi:integrase